MSVFSSSILFLLSGFDRGLSISFASHLGHRFYEGIGNADQPVRELDRNADCSSRAFRGLYKVLLLTRSDKHRKRPQCSAQRLGVVDVSGARHCAQCDGKFSHKFGGITKLPLRHLKVSRR
nr:MAG TPA: hypothetical protein [Caudoviricetes sp.]